MTQIEMNIAAPCLVAAPAPVSPRPDRHPCLLTLSRIAAAGCPERLAFISPRFALGCGAGRYTVAGYGVTGRGASWGEAADQWAALSKAAVFR